MPWFRYCRQMWVYHLDIHLSPRGPGSLICLWSVSITRSGYGLSIITRSQVLGATGKPTTVKRFSDSYHIMSRKQRLFLSTDVTDSRVTFPFPPKSVFLNNCSASHCTCVCCNPRTTRTRNMTHFTELIGDIRDVSVTIKALIVLWSYSWFRLLRQFVSDVHTADHKSRD